MTKSLGYRAVFIGLGSVAVAALIAVAHYMRETGGRSRICAGLGGIVLLQLSKSRQANPAAAPLGACRIPRGIPGSPGLRDPCLASAKISSRCLIMAKLVAAIFLGYIQCLIRSFHHGGCVHKTIC